MPDLRLESNQEVEQVFKSYPDHVRVKMLTLRALVIETAQEIKGLSTLEETLKWGEPSYLAKHGSTLRMDWKPKRPDQYALYFKCTSKLVETFRHIFKDTLDYEANRAIVFKVKDDLPKDELKQCIKATLTYHKVKHLPLLGMT
jgi:hypothetical protein